jgi:hypothetical protein
MSSCLKVVSGNLKLVSGMWRGLESCGAAVAHSMPRERTNHRLSGTPHAW